MCYSLGPVIAKGSRGRDILGLENIFLFFIFNEIFILVSQSVIKTVSQFVREGWEEEIFSFKRKAQHIYNMVI